MLRTIDLTTISEPLRGTLQHRLAGFEGRPVTDDLIQTVVTEISEVDSHLDLTWRISHTEGATVLSVQKEKRPSFARPATVNFPSSGEQRVRIGGAVLERKLILRKPPVYPPLARQARLQGTVRFNVLIGSDGRLRNLQLVSGHPLLVDAATDALREWVYEPTLIGGKPVEVVTQVDVNFTLSDL